jgi:hypothetical protein
MRPLEKGDRVVRLLSGDEPFLDADGNERLGTVLVVEYGGPRVGTIVAVRLDHPSNPARPVLLTRASLARCV